VAPVLAGEGVSVADQARLQRAVRNAEGFSGLIFSVYLGIAEENTRAYAERLHASLDDPDHSVLVMCDPEFRALEIVTGVQARRTLNDGECALAAAAMQSSFVAGDIVGGLVTGIQQLGEAGQTPPTLHSRHID
jgi:hypothetical protein